ncbi:MAG: hypothetical protein MHPSP_003210, partial [Paramarteilia canceri]
FSLRPEDNKQVKDFVYRSKKSFTPENQGIEHDKYSIYFNDHYESSNSESESQSAHDGPRESDKNDGPNDRFADKLEEMRKME